MAKKLNPIYVQQELQGARMTIFTPLEFQRLFRVSAVAARFFLFDYTRKNFFIRLKNGLYTLAANPPPEWAIANKLYSPSYISFEYALAYHQMIPEMPYEVTSATTKPSRRFEVGDKIFRYHRIRPRCFTGYQPLKIEDITVLMAEPEKALVDYLYFAALKKKPLIERLQLKKITKKRAMAYAKIFRHSGLINLVKDLI